MVQLYNPAVPANATTANADEVRNNLNSLATFHKGPNPPASAQGGWIWLDDNDYSGFGALHIYNPATAVAAFVELVGNVYDVPYLGYWREPKTNTASVTATTPDYDWELHLAKNTGIQTPILWAYDPTSPATWRRVAPGAGAGLLYDTTDEEYDVDTGVTANKIVKLTAAAKLPAVDGSLLTNNVVKVQNAVMSPTATATDSVALLAGLGIDITFGSLDDVTFAIDSSAVVTSFDKYGSGSPAFVGDVYLMEDSEQSVVVTPNLSNNALMLTARCGIVDDDWLIANTDVSPTVLEGDLTDWTRSVLVRLGISSPVVVDTCEVLRAIILKLNTIQISQIQGFIIPAWEDKGTTLNPGNPFQGTPVFTPYFIAPSTSFSTLPTVSGNEFPSGGSAESGILSLSLQTGILYNYESNTDTWEPINPIQIREDAVQRNNGWPGVLNFVGAGVDVVEQSIQNGVSSITISIPGVSTNHQDSHQAGAPDELQGMLAVDGTDRLSFTIGDGLDSDKFIYLDVGDGVGANPGFRYNTTTDKMQFRTEGASWVDISAAGAVGNTFTFGDGTDTDKTIVADIGAGTNPAIKYETSTNDWEMRIENGAYGAIAFEADVPTVFYMNFVVTGDLVTGDFLLGQIALTPDAGVPMQKACTLDNVYVTDHSAQATFSVRFHNVSVPTSQTVTHTNSLFSANSTAITFTTGQQLAIQMLTVASPVATSFTLTLEFSYN